jgi:Icc-related predicted phosphoesterase
VRLLVLSDLHLEMGASLTLPPGLAYDVVVLAGDIHSPGHKAVHWAARASTFGGKPVVLVPGNHEFYGCELSTELDAMRKAAEGTNVHVLSRNSIDIDGVRFLGATLWTDFSVPIANESEPISHHVDSDVARALDAARKHVMDYRRIELSVNLSRGQSRVERARRHLTPEDTLAWHWIERDWLRRQIDVGSGGPTVVVTHHAPSRRSIAPRFASDWVTPAFVSDLPADFFEARSMWLAGAEQRAGPILWIHGHTHSAFDYRLGGCRIVSNPRGYRMRDGTFENHSFDAGLVVDVEEGGER